jgi:hypothetical protein
MSNRGRKVVASGFQIGTASRPSARATSGRDDNDCECRLWVKLGLRAATELGPLYPQQQTSLTRAGLSAKGQKETFRHILTKQPEAAIFAVRLAEWNSADRSSDRAAVEGTVS